MSRNDALAAYEALPLPDTTEEHWRFTNLRGFDPDAFAGAASAEIETLLDLDVAGYATVTADGIEIEKVPEGVTFEPLPEEHERLYSLVGWDEKFAAHNAALWQNGLLVVVPKGVELEHRRRRGDLGRAVGTPRLGIEVLEIGEAPVLLGRVRERQRLVGGERVVTTHAARTSGAASAGSRPGP